MESQWELFDFTALVVDLQDLIARSFLDPATRCSLSLTSKVYYGKYFDPSLFGGNFIVVAIEQGHVDLSHWLLFTLNAPIRQPAAFKAFYRFPENQSFRMVRFLFEIFKYYYEIAEIADEEVGPVDLNSDETEEVFQDVYEFEEIGDRKNHDFQETKLPIENSGFGYNERFDLGFDLEKVDPFDNEYLGFMDDVFGAFCTVAKRAPDIDIQKIPCSTFLRHLMKYFWDGHSIFLKHLVSSGNVALLSAFQGMITDVQSYLQLRRYFFLPSLAITSSNVSLLITTAIESSLDMFTYLSNFPTGVNVYSDPSSRHSALTHVRHYLSCNTNIAKDLMEWLVEKVASNEFILSMDLYKVCIRKGYVDCVRSIIHLWTPDGSFASRDSFLDNLAADCMLHPNHQVLRLIIGSFECPSLSMSNLAGTGFVEGLLDYFRDAPNSPDISMVDWVKCLLELTPINKRSLFFTDPNSDGFYNLEGLIYSFPDLDVFRWLLNEQTELKFEKQFTFPYLGELRGKHLEVYFEVIDYCVQKGFEFVPTGNHIYPFSIWPRHSQYPDQNGVSVLDLEPMMVSPKFLKMLYRIIGAAYFKPMESISLQRYITYISEEAPYLRVRQSEALEALALAFVLTDTVLTVLFRRKIEDGLGKDLIIQLESRIEMLRKQSKAEIVKLPSKM